MSEAPVRVTKIMALDRAEFERSLALLAPSARLDAHGRVALAEAAGRISLTFEPLPPETLGRLLALPRARLTLAFSGLTDAERAAFLARFDRAFQRGGG